MFEFKFGKYFILEELQSTLQETDAGEPATDSDISWHLRKINLEKALKPKICGCPLLK
jgi:hypothetical protein